MAARVTHHKVVLLGDSAVGKSCLVLRFVRNEFNEFQEPTIGAAFLTQTMSVAGSVIKLEIWDTAGQERYKSLAPMYYRGAQAAIIVYDVTRKDSFEGAKAWIKELETRADPGIIVALAGNKCDLQDNREVEREEALSVANSAKCIFGETSAKSGIGVSELFQQIGKW